MATASPFREDNYELELGRVREKIKTKFVEIINCLKARESELLRELDDVLAAYHSYRNELENVKNKVKKLNRMKQQQEKELTSSLVKPLINRLLCEINLELESIETPVEPQMVSFECDSSSNALSTGLKRLGWLVVTTESGAVYKSKKLPLVSVCEKGSGSDQLYRPRGVTVDNKTGNIFVADLDNHCVKVFDRDGKYLSKFGDLETENMMYYPISVAMCGDRILISQGCHCISNYDLDGRFICKIGKLGEGELEFNWPTGLAIDESNGNIYISDCDNNRIQILFRDFRYSTQFGKDTLKSPQDVKLSEKYVFVLDESNPCLHLFTYNHILQKSIISRGKRMQLVRPCYFFIDPTQNVLISDGDSESIHIFSSEFQLLHTISVSQNPMGISVDNKGRVIIVCQARDNCLQVF